MTLAFSTHINKVATYFVEKIWEGFHGRPTTPQVKRSDLDDLFEKYHEQLLPEFRSKVQPKFHTIRKDEKNLWKEGRDIHMVIHNRTPKRFQFAPVVKCMSVQKIEIQYHDKPLGERIATVHIDGQQYGTAIWKDCKLIHNSSRLDLLAANDGFESVNDFFEYFDKDFTGKIIQWTNLKY